MPITSSAKKAQRQNIRRRAVNEKRKAALKTVIKKFEKLLATEKKEAGKYLSNVYQRIDKSVKVNLIKANKAARLKSRLSRLLRANAD